jgi:hypothetical protein
VSGEHSHSPRWLTVFGDSSSRHQLNHNPKQIYKCNFRNCDRIFVREDLLSRHKERHSNSDKEYQWQYEDTRIHCHSTIDTTFSDSTNVPDSSHSPPTSETEVLASLFMGPDNILHQHLRPDVSQQRSGATNYSPDSFVLEPARIPKTVHELMDQDIDFSYNDQTQQDSNGPEYPSQELNAPHLYDSCALWQDELAMSGNMPDFGGQGYNRSPFTMSDDFISFLFEGIVSDNGPSMPIMPLATAKIAK